MGEDKVCFVIGPIGKPGSETRKRSNQLLKHVIDPVVKPRGYETLRADLMSVPGMITPQIIDRVRDSDLVVADLAERNPNVFYELAIRHAEKKPLIQIMAEGEEIPFDVQDMRTIAMDIHDVDSVAEAKEALSGQLDAIEKREFQMNTPISVAMDLSAYRNSDDLESRALADVLEAIGQLKTAVVAVERRLARLEPGAGQREDPHAEPRPTSADVELMWMAGRTLEELDKELALRMAEVLRQRPAGKRMDAPQEDDDAAEGQP